MNNFCLTTVIDSTIGVLFTIFHKLRTFMSIFKLNIAEFQDIFD